jgi:hypothetical protein
MLFTFARKSRQKKVTLSFPNVTLVGVEGLEPPTLSV